MATLRIRVANNGSESAATLQRRWFGFLWRDWMPLNLNVLQLERELAQGFVKLVSTYHKLHTEQRLLRERLKLPEVVSQDKAWKTGPAFNGTITSWIRSLPSLTVDEKKNLDKAKRIVRVSLNKGSVLAKAEAIVFLKEGKAKADKESGAIRTKTIVPEGLEHPVKLPSDEVIRPQDVMSQVVSGKDRRRNESNRSYKEPEDL